MKTKEEKIKERLFYLYTMIRKYSYAYHNHGSNRTLKWIIEYDDLKDENREIFLSFCKDHDFDATHDASDLLA